MKEDETAQEDDRKVALRLQSLELRRDLLPEELTDDGEEAVYSEVRPTYE